MSLFVPIFFAVYSLLHYYAYRKLSSVFGLPLWGRLLLIVLFTFTTLSPAVWRLLDRRGLNELAQPLAFVGLMWMGFLFYFFLVGIVIDLYRRFHSPTPKRAFFITLVVSIVLSAYSHAETHFLQVERFTLRTPKLPEGTKLKILHISDLHLGPVMREDKAQLVLEVYEREKPHIVVATGDMVDGNMKGSEHLADMLAKMKPPLGKFAVVGNHEFYVGLEQSVAFLERAGFRVLRGESTAVGGLLNIAGVDDPDGERFGYRVFTDELKALKGADQRRFTILIKHRPTVDREALDKVDLVLAGHTHGGVLFFVGYTVLRLPFETDRGVKELEAGKFMVVSKGVGTGGPPMRLLSPPDVFVVELVGTKALSQQASPLTSRP